LAIPNTWLSATSIYRYRDTAKFFIPDSLLVLPEWFTPDNIDDLAHSVCIFDECDTV